MTTKTITLTDSGACTDTSDSTSDSTKPGKSIVFVSRETGTFWLAGWLFTIGIAGLSFWKGVLALIIWPYFLGSLFVGG